MHEVLIDRIGGLSLPRKRVVRLTGRPDMTLDVYRGRKTTTTILWFFILSTIRGGWVVRWSWVNFQCRASYNLDNSTAGAYCACSRCGWGRGIFRHFYSPILFSPLPPSLWETARYRLKYCLKGPLNPKQPTNQPIHYRHSTWNPL